MRYAAILCVAGLVLSGCGGGSPHASPTTPAPSTTVPSSPAETPTPTPTATLPGQLAGAGTVTGVAFTGSTVHPTITVTGTGLGTRPAPNPAYAPEGHPGCPLPPKGIQGLDYGVSFWLADVPRHWSAGRYRPELGELDCIGVVSTTFTQTSVVFTLGSAYADYQQQSGFLLAEGDAYQLVVNGAAYDGTVHYTKG